MKKNKRLYIEQLENQIKNTINALQGKHLLYTYNDIYRKQIGTDKWILSWNNHQHGKFNTGHYFLKIEQYKTILDNNSFLCVLFDGSIIRISYIFEDNKLISHNLLWWPAPYNYPNVSLDDVSPYELIESFIKDSDWYDTIRMRSPVRVDYDPNAVSEMHSAIHVHMQHENCRIVMQEPLCFNRFMEFILKNYYPDISFYFDENDYINFKIKVNDDIEYLNSKIII